MYRTKISAITLLGTILVASVAADDPGHSGHKAFAHTKQVDSAFERFKGLAGDWEIVSTKDESQHGKIASRYHLTAGGNAVVETVFPGEEMEMVTVYHRDGDQLMLTHYCHLGNQPRMRTKSIDDNGELVFHFAGGGESGPGARTRTCMARESASSMRTIFIPNGNFTETARLPK